MIDPFTLVGEVDAMKWAECFTEKATEKPEIATDKNVMVAWFANAIMAGYDKVAKDIKDSMASETSSEELIGSIETDEEHY